MNIILKNNIFLLLSVSMIIAKDSPNNWHSYWAQSSKAIIMDESNQWLLGGAAIAALSATQIDIEVKDYVIEHNLLLSYQFEWHPKQLLQHSLIATGLIHL